MVGAPNRGEIVRQFIIDNVEENASEIARITADRFDISRQAVSVHLQKLVADGLLTSTGQTRSRRYALAPLEEWRGLYVIGPSLAEDHVWLQDISPALGGLAENVVQIWHYSFTEIFNNAVEHSEGEEISVFIEKTAADTRVTISDDGVGIFRKIQSALDLVDVRQAPLELAKGKFTTDPEHHSGEGIFFSSRMFDEFAIVSGSVCFIHGYGDAEDWILEQDSSAGGTEVFMKLGNHTDRTTKQVFDRFTTDEEYGFTKTVVPVKLAQYGDDNLVSRSQARRLLTRFERFESVWLDFTGVDSIGQAFADEIFRVFPHMHPTVEIIEVNANPAVQRMVARARSHR